MKLQGVTVRELLKLPILKDAIVISGARGLDRVVRYIDVLEVPDIKGWLREGEMVLTTGYSMRNDPSKLASIVDHLDQVNGAAIAIKPQRFLVDIPSEMIAKSEEAGIPLLQIPSDIPYIDITYTIMELIIDRQGALLRRSEEIHKTLTNLILTSGGLQAITENVAGLVNASVQVLGKAGERLAYAPAGLREEPPPHDMCVSFDLTVDKQTVGKLIVGKPVLDDLERVGVEQARLVYSLEFMGRKIAEDTEARLRGSFFEEVLTGLPFSRQEIESKGRQFGIRPDWKWDICVIEGDPEAVSIGSAFVQQLEALLEREALKCKVRAHSLRQGDRLVLLLAVEEAAGPHARQPKRNKPEWIDLLTPLLKSAGKLRAGIGNRRALWEASRGYAEARRAIGLGIRLDRSQQVFQFDDLEMFHLLLEATEYVHFDPIVDRTIGALALYDKENGTDLITTLYYYLATGGSLYETASKLFIHRNSVKYRIDRMKEIAGIDLTSPLTGTKYYLCTVFYLLKKLD